MDSDVIDILLVDDSQDDVDLTLHALRAESLANHVVVARDGEEALDFLFCTGPHRQRSFEHPPKLVLLDLKLPKVDGMQVLQQIKSDPRTKTIPVVLMTSSREEREWRRATTWGLTATCKSRLISSSSGKWSNFWDCIGWLQISLRLLRAARRRALWKSRLRGLTRAGEASNRLRRPPFVRVLNPREILSWGRRI